MKMQSIAILGLLFSLNVMAGTNPSPHEQVTAQLNAQKVAKHVHDNTGKIYSGRSDKASSAGK